MHLNIELLNRKAKKVKHVIAGPWVGEFGWELMCYQAGLRWIVQENPHLESFTVISKPGHKALYDDFCTDYIEYSPSSEHNTGALCMGWQYDNFHEKVISNNNRFLDSYLWIPTNHFLLNYHLGGPEKNHLMKDFIHKQVFRSYKINVEKDKSILLHARDSVKYDSANRNWTHENWDKTSEFLKEKGYSVIAIGMSNHSYVPKYSDNKQDITIHELIKLMSKATMIVGSSSGPMHLASLCELPQVVLSRSENIIRYGKDWNPFATQAVLVEDDNWKPSYEAVIEGIQKIHDF